MTVRLGAVTKRGHAEAIFDGFGPFWGWFSIFDLAVVNWLTLITEYIGMTAAMSMFGVPPVITCIAVTAILMAVVMTGQAIGRLKSSHWSFAFSTSFIFPAAIWAMQTPTAPGWRAVAKGIL